MFAATPGCEVVDVVSARDADAVVRLCHRRDVDLISVHSPPFLHGRDVRLALDGGHHVLCDKPFGLDAGESAALLSEAEAAGVVHLVNFELRHEPARVQLKRLLADGAVGRVEHVTWTHHSAGSRVPLRPHGWLFTRALGGGWVGAWASHAVDTLRWLLDDEVAEAAARLRTTIAERPSPDGGEAVPVDAEDALSAWLRMAGGATVTVDSTFAAAADRPPRLTVFGSDGVAECVADRRVTLRRPGADEEAIDVEAASGDRHGRAMATWAAVVREAVDERRPTSPSFADGVACDVVLDRLRAGPRT